MKENLMKVMEAINTSLGITTEVVGACEEAKGRDISVLQVSGITDMVDYFVIVTGRSDRQVQGISNRILATLGQKGVAPYSIEGLEGGHWVLLDFEDVVVHVFYEPLRSHYDLEGLWSTAKKIALPETAESLKAA